MTLHKINRHLITAGILLVLSSFSSCKYSFTGASISPEIRTISVDYFKSFAPLAPPILEQTFTEALKEIFISQTNLRLVESGGDLHFEGRITGYQSKPIAIGADQRANQERLTISVRVKFTNMQEPKNDFDKPFSRYQDYDANKNLQEIETALIEDINEQLVQTIFDAAVSNW